MFARPGILQYLVAAIIFLGSSSLKAGELAEIDLPPEGYDIRAFRNYCKEKGVPPIKDDSIRVFIMGAGRVEKAIEISLKTGRCEIWPDSFEETKSEVLTLQHQDRVRISAALVRKDLEAIPVTDEPTVDGWCHLLEIKDDKGYFWRLHRNSKSGYFLSLAFLVEVVAENALDVKQRFEAKTLQ